MGNLIMGFSTGQIAVFWIFLLMLAIVFLVGAFYALRSGSFGGGLAAFAAVYTLILLILALENLPPP